MIKVAHYLNQFFAGIGGEDKADIPLNVIDGPVGPGVALQAQLKDRAQIVATLYAGDNYANECNEAFVDDALERLKAIQPDVLVAGPAFNAGRYGIACASLLTFAHQRLNIPVVTAFSPENPAMEAYQRYLYIVPTSRSAAGMAKALPPLARLVLRLAERVELGPAREEGYVPRGIRKNAWTGEGAACRAVNLAIARTRGAPFMTELEILPFDRVAPPPRVPDLSKAIIALVTEGGLVPAGNPDRLETQNATKWFHYLLPGDDLKKGEYECWHGGHLPDRSNEDPDRNLPLDVMRVLEREGIFGKLYDEYCVTCGNAGTISTMRRIGSEIGAYLKQKGVSAVVLTAT